MGKKAGYMFNPGRFSMCVALETINFDTQLLSNVGHQGCWQMFVRAENSAGISHDGKLQGEAKFVVGTAPKLDFQ